MKDVARMAGVSPMSVSRTLGNPESVSQDIRERVRQVVEKSGYVPNRMAGSLSSSRTTLIALIVPSLRNALHAEMIQGISDVLLRHNFQLMISDCGNSLELEERLIRTYLEQQVCGIILHKTAHGSRTPALIKAAGIPCVETGNLVANPIDMAVSYSNFEASKAMAAHLLASGYRRFAFVSLPLKHRERLTAMKRGFLSGLKAHGIKEEAVFQLETNAGMESGADAIEQIQRRSRRTDAVFFAGDVLATGALFECHRRGIKVPSDLAIAASDDNEVHRNSFPTITSIGYPRYQIGVRSAELIVERSSGAKGTAHREDVGFEIVRGGST
ncbi:MAG: LacI family DNA-binding transcriptional regulator [Pseudomonadota bacterium]